MMILRHLTLPLRATSAIPISRQCVRFLHHTVPMRPIPAPIPFCPDHETFLKLIGRDLSQHAEKIGSWDALFTLTSDQLRDMGVEPPRARRYLLQWRERFRNGEYGIGGDLAEVKDGVAEVRIVQKPISRSSTQVATASRAADKIKIVVNVPQGQELPNEPLDKAPRVKGMQVKRSGVLCGPHIQKVAGTGGQVARLEAKEGLWEIKRGRKIDGGERRRAEVRAKRMALQNKELREKAGI